MVSAATQPFITAWRGAGSQGAMSAVFQPAASLPNPLETWLSEHGFSVVDRNARIVNQTTPVMHAARLGRADMIAALLLVGADISLRNADGNNALWLACFSDDAASIDILIAAGIDIDNRNDNGSTCLMYAASAGKAPVVRQLLSAGAALRIENLDGFTALDMAASLDCLQLLRQVHRMASATLTDSQGAHSC